MDLGTVKTKLQGALGEVISTFRGKHNHRPVSLGEVVFQVKRVIKNGSKRPCALPEPLYSLLDMARDLRTVWHNCCIYNAEGSAIVRMARCANQSHPWRVAPSKLLGSEDTVLVVHFFVMCSCCRTTFSPTSW